MKRYTLSLLTGILLLTAATTSKAEAQVTKTDNPVTGTWTGTLDVGVMKLRLVFNISQTDQDSLRATLQSPDQGPAIFPIRNVTHSADSLLIDAPLLGAKYSGLITGNDRIEGTWEQSGMKMPLILNRQESEFRLVRPQEPIPPFPYKSEEVNFKNSKEGITLSATLTLPDGEGPFPAMILIPGSGANNRDQEIMGHKYFAVLADHFTRNGIAVLRYDERGVGKSEGIHNQATTADLADDARSAFEFLKNHTGVNSTMTGITGHSEGSLIASMVAAGRDDVAFVVSLAGPGVTGEEVLHRQTEDISRALRVSPEDIRAARDINERLYSVVKRTRNNERAEERVMKAYARELKKTGIPEENINERVQSLRFSFNADSYTWFRYFLTANPADWWTKVKSPVLILNGEKDLQIDAHTNSDAIARALQRGGNSDYRVALYPELNHLFQNATLGLPGEYGIIEETISPEVLDTITNWIRDNLR